METVELFFAHTITLAFVAVMVPATVLLILGTLSWPIALVLFPFLAGGGRSARSSLSELPSGWAPGFDTRSAYVHAFMVDSIQGLKEIAAFGQGEARAEAVTSNGWKLADFGGNHSAINRSRLGSIEAMIGLAGLAVLTTGAVIIAHGGLPRWYLPLITVLSLSAFGPVTESAKTAKVAASRRWRPRRRLFAVQDEPVPVETDPVCRRLRPLRHHE